MRPSNLKCEVFQGLQKGLSKQLGLGKEIEKDYLLLEIFNIIDESLTLEQIIEEELAAQGLENGVLRPKSDQNYR